MKRNKESNQKKRRKSSAKYLEGGGDSKYAQKVKAGHQMYRSFGWGCGANKKPANYNQDFVEALRKWSRANFMPNRKLAW